MKTLEDYAVEATEYYHAHKKEEGTYCIDYVCAYVKTLDLAEIDIYTIARNAPSATYATWADSLAVRYDATGANTCAWADDAILIYLIWEYTQGERKADWCTMFRVRGKCAMPTVKYNHWSYGGEHRIQFTLIRAADCTILQAEVMY